MGAKKVPMTQEELSKAVAEGKIQPDLPPPGHERKEVLAKRKDKLEQQAEEFANDTRTYAIDPSKLEEEREIQRELRRKRKRQSFFHIEIPGYVVRYVDYVHNEGGAAWTAKLNGWIPVTREMLPPEQHFMCRAADGTVRVADVMAFCIPEVIYQDILEEEEEDRLKKEYGLESEVYRLADKHEGKFKFHSNLSGENQFIDDVAGKFGKGPRSRAASKMALKHIGNKMKDGYVPGIPNR
jgi:hypothetical protein